MEVDQSEAKYEESEVDENKTIAKSVEIENTSLVNESKDIEACETSSVAEQASSVEASEVFVKEDDSEAKQSEKSVETDVHMTEKECDKPSETIEKSDETVDDSKMVETVVQESPEELAQKTSILNVSLPGQFLKSVFQSAILLSASFLWLFSCRYNFGSSLYSMQCLTLHLDNSIKRTNYSLYAKNPNTCFVFVGAYKLISKKIILCDKFEFISIKTKISYYVLRRSDRQK